MSHAQTAPGQVERYLRHATKEWILNSELAAHVGISPNMLPRLLAGLIEAGVIHRSYRGKGGLLQWRLAPAVTPIRTFSIPNWPPGFVSQFDTIKVPAWDGSRS